MEVYHLVYVTANDTLFFKDYIHFCHMLKYPPGVDPVRFYLVVAETKPFTTFQKRMLRLLMGMIAKAKHYQPQAIIFRSNAGRDFGSVKDALDHISKNAQPGDYVMVRNRSARGPFRDHWYKAFVDQLSIDPKTALVGNTISWNDHPKRKLTENVRHVQTYAYLSQWKYLQMLMEDFPGRYATDHLEAVLQGEIELSQQLMQRGYKMTSLQYPGLWIDAQNQNAIKTENYTPVDRNQLPFHNLNPPRTIGYYFKALLTLTSMFRHMAHRKPSYEIITLP